jgi:hypothetical protein
VIERSEDLGFPLKTCHALGVSSKDLGQNFERYIPVQLGVVGTVDFSHPSFADLLDDLVVRDGPLHHVRLLGE